MGMKKREKQSNVGICALCKNESNLEGSHIIPKFAFKHLKNDAFTKRIRNVGEPNRALQDGPKKRMLCGKCEDLFSVYETSFSTRIFHPFQNNELNRHIVYDGDWLNKFITSVNWRVLYTNLESQATEQNPIKKFTAEEIEILSSVSELMRSYLLNEVSSLYHLENHIIFYKENLVANRIFKNPHVTIFGAIYGAPLIIEKEKSMYILTNLSGVIIVTMIKKHPEEVWINTQVQNGSGVLNLRQEFLSPIIKALKSTEVSARKYAKELSPNQYKKLQELIEKDPEGFIKSSSFKRSPMGIK
ncbi:hypothetical protein P4I98_04165 [Bacillus cereus]|nr:hypothetical protein [Bacillus cereus]